MSTSEKTPEKVCVVICNWNKVQELLDCVESVLKLNYSNFDIVVVDNGSDPQYGLEVKKNLHPSITLIKNEKNEGVAAGFNRGMHDALDRGIYDSILILDDDVIVDPECLPELVKELRKSPDNAIIGPMVLWMNFPELLQEFGAFFDREEILDYFHMRYCPISKVGNQVISVDYVMACCLLVDVAKLKKVGLMDPGYFWYCDDADWCMQFKRFGYEVKATSSAKVWHKGAGANKTSGTPRYYYWRSIIYFYLHNMDSDRDFERYVDKFLIQRVLGALFITLKTGKIQSFKTILKGITDGFCGVRGKLKENIVFPLDPCKYGTDFTDIITNLIVISDSNVPDDSIQPFLKMQKQLVQPVTYYGAHHRNEQELLKNVSQESESKTILVLCAHILTKPNQYEEVLHDLLLEKGNTVYFIDLFENLVQGFAKVKQIREQYKALLNTAYSFRNELIQFVKQKYVEFFRPLVSVVIPTYNQADFLVEAITSAQNQTYPNIEIVVVNDGSTDNTTEILKKLSEQDQRIRCFSQENQGLASAFNKAVQESKGEYIVHLDSDDIYETEKIQKQLEILQQDKSIDLVYTAIQVIDKEGKPLMQMRGSDVDPDTFRAQMFFRNIIPNPTTLMGKRACFIDIPYREKYKRSMDYDFELRLAEKYRFKYLDLPLTRWRRYDRNMSNELAKCKEEQLEILKNYDADVLMNYVDKAKLDHVEKLMLKGNILYNLEMWVEAYEQFNQVKTATGDFYSGNCLYKMGKSKEAIVKYRQCVKENPNHAACWNNLGVALGDSKEAKECFQKALQIRPEYLDPQYNLANNDKRFTDRELRPTLIPYVLQ
jgi:GT2 family glycosyltransferase